MTKDIHTHTFFFFFFCSVLSYLFWSLLLKKQCWLKPMKMVSELTNRWDPMMWDPMRSYEIHCCLYCTKGKTDLCNKNDGALCILPSAHLCSPNPSPALMSQLSWTLIVPQWCCPLLPLTTLTLLQPPASLILPVLPVSAPMSLPLGSVTLIVLRVFITYQSLC